MAIKSNSAFNFSASYHKLEKISEWFERDDFDLEESLVKFEEGIKLTKELKRYLTTMENKIKELKKDL